MSERKSKIIRVLLGLSIGLCIIGAIVGLVVGLKSRKDNEDSTQTVPIIVTSENPTAPPSGPPTAPPTTTAPSTTTTKAAPPPGWREWSEWTACSVTCGLGQVSRSRECVTGQNYATDICPDPNGEGRFQVRECNKDLCLTGKDMINTEVEKATRAGIEHNLFLNRYPQSVTLNGEAINENASKTEGYGAWRMTRDDYELVLNSSDITVTSDARRSRRSLEVSISLIVNVNIVCNLNLTTIDIDSALQLANKVPCFSMMAFVTLLKVKGLYPVSVDFVEQGKLLLSLTSQIQINWEVVLNEELKNIQNDCVQADIDFEFVIDSSGSVGLTHWKTTMLLVGEKWINEIIKPNGSKTCGNHVAGRWFSSSTKRFFDFEPPPKSQYRNETYSDYVGNLFVNTQYNSGLTHTANALRAVREEDLIMARQGLKYVMIFTDGQSNGPLDLNQEALLLNELANRTYAFGIGNGIDQDELKIIASNDTFTANMTNFDDLEAFARIFTIQQKGCYTPVKRPYRAVDIKLVSQFGMSSKTAAISNNNSCTDSQTCPDNDEIKRSENCVTCSEIIAQQHEPLLEQIKSNVVEAASNQCFPPEILLGLISRLSIENGTFQTGWQPCKLKNYYYENCYGLMHIRESLNPNTNHTGDSVEHFTEGITNLIQIISQLTQMFGTFIPEQQTRAGLAAYDAGACKIRSKNSIDKETTNGDFSADIFARAKYIETFIY